MHKLILQNLHCAKLVVSTLLPGKRLVIDITVLPDGQDRDASSGLCMHSPRTIRELDLQRREKCEGARRNTFGLDPGTYQKTRLLVDGPRITGGSSHQQQTGCPLSITPPRCSSNAIVHHLAMARHDRMLQILCPDICEVKGSVDFH